jgi:predicted dehydrogenase
MTILVVGGGKMGLSHLAIASRIAGKQEVALCDSSWSTRFLFKRLKFETFESSEAALNAGRPIKGVIIATPTSSHYPIAKAALEHSIPCFIEKPLTLDVRKSRELCDLASGRGTYAQVGFVLRFVATFARLRAIVHSGVLGAPRSYRGRMNGNVITKAENDGWRTDFKRGGGCLNEYGPHLIDLCRYIFGDVSQLRSARKEHVYSTRADDKIAFEWEHADGLVGNLSLDWCDTSKRKSVIEFEVEFEHGRISVDNSAFRIEFAPAAPLSESQRTQLRQPGVPSRVSFYLRGEEFTLQLEAFLEQCLGRQLRIDAEFGAVQPAGISDGLAVDTLIETIAQTAGIIE